MRIIHYYSKLFTGVLRRQAHATDRKLRLRAVLLLEADAAAKAGYAKAVKRATSREVAYVFSDSELERIFF